MILKIELSFFMSFDELFLAFNCIDTTYLYKVISCSVSCLQLRSNKTILKTSLTLYQCIRIEICEHCISDVKNAKKNKTKK